MERKDYPRVSEILTQIKDFSHIPKPVLEAKANDGTIVHKAITDHILGNEPYFFSPTYQDMEKKEKEIDFLRAIRRSLYFQSFLKWQEFLKPTIEVREPEWRLYDDDLRYRGAIDGLCSFKSGIPCLIDFKTSASEDPITWPLQGHMYHNLLMKNGSQLEDTLLFMQLDPKGEYPKVHKYVYKSESWDYCKRLITVYHEKGGCTKS